jgi:hypothetical protein
VIGEAGKEDAGAAGVRVGPVTIGCDANHPAAGKLVTASALDAAL